MEVLGLVRACRQSCSVLLISNATSRLKRDLQALGVTDEFDHVLNTSEFGYAKPDPRAFTSALERAGVSADEALFIDDGPHHVEAARSLGIQGHHYTGVGPLRRQLQELRLLLSVQ